MINNVEIQWLPLKEPLFEDKSLAWQHILNRVGRRSVGYKLKRYVLPWGVAAACFVGVRAYVVADVECVSNNDNYSCAFPDGSSVVLSKGSSMKMNSLLWKINRKVHLNGKATFSVVDGHPFVVTTGVGDVVVLGTEFYCEAEGENLVVSCYSGKVQVNYSHNEYIVGKGESIVCSPSDVKKTIINSNADIEPWFFDSVPVIEVLSVLEREFNVKFSNKADFSGEVFSGGIPKSYNKAVGILEGIYGKKIQSTK